MSLVRLLVLGAALAVGACATGGDGRSGAAPPLADDDDRDGVAGTDDVCPGSAAGEIVGADGCALFARVLDGVSFAPGDHRLGTDARAALRRLVADLEAHPDVVLRIEGHTDNRGRAADNLELSKRRVMSVARFLVANGVPPARLRPYGYGESRPRLSNATPEGRERNRRIEIGTEGPAREAPRPASAPGEEGGDALAEPLPARQNDPMPEGLT